MIELTVRKEAAVIAGPLRRHELGIIGICENTQIQVAAKGAYSGIKRDVFGKDIRCVGVVELRRIAHACCHV